MRVLRAVLVPGSWLPGIAVVGSLGTSQPQVLMRAGSVSTAPPLHSRRAVISASCGWGTLKCWFMV
jgi:hypothetical protein